MIEEDEFLKSVDDKVLSLANLPLLVPIYSFSSIRNAVC